MSLGGAAAALWRVLLGRLIATPTGLGPGADEEDNEVIVSDKKCVVFCSHNLLPNKCLANDTRMFVSSRDEPSNVKIVARVK